MGYGHSLDLRQRIIETVRSGSSARAAARRFGVSVSSAIILVSRWRKTGSYAPRQVGGQKRRKLSGHKDWLYEVMAFEPDITLNASVSYRNGNNCLLILHQGEQNPPSAARGPFLRKNLRNKFMANGVPMDIALNEVFSNDLRSVLIAEERVEEIDKIDPIFLSPGPPNLDLNGVPVFFENLMGPRVDDQCHLYLPLRQKSVEFS